MEFIETPTFTRRVLDLMIDDEYARLQHNLIQRPGSGKIIPGSGGIRKMRWKCSGGGKSGGARVIYYWQVSANQIWLLLVYRKNEIDDLTKNQIKQLKQLVFDFES